MLHVMEYLPTFSLKSPSSVGKYTSTMEHMGCNFLPLRPGADRSAWFIKWWGNPWNLRKKSMAYHQFSPLDMICHWIFNILIYFNDPYNIHIISISYPIYIYIPYHIHYFTYPTYYPQIQWLIWFHIWFIVWFHINVCYMGYPTFSDTPFG